MNAIALRTGIVAVSLLLAWRVLQVNLVLFDEAGRPRLPSTPSAVALASDGEFLRRVLEDNPGQVDALVFLARERERAGDLRGTRRAYQVAFELAPMDREVLGSGAEFFLKQGEPGPALAMLDHLVERYPEAQPRVFPVLARLLAEHRDPAAWNAIAARKAAWIGPFIVSACREGTDPETLAALFLDRAREHRATTEEAACLIDRLRDTDRWQQAYQLWLNTLTPDRYADVGHIFNGSFEYAASGVGFDWILSRGRERDLGHVVEVSEVSGKRALHVSYNGKRQTGMPAMQYLALPPGRYEMSGNARPQSMGAGRGIQWAVRCVKGGKLQSPLAASEPFVGSSEWRPFSFQVTVPAACPGQLLQLEPVGLYTEGIVYLAGSAWFDELVLRRRG
jgi:hypothetical protein